MKQWPERRVVRAGVSPMNPRVKWAELSCGHEVFRARKPRIGATVVCDKCASEPAAGGSRGAPLPPAPIVSDMKPPYPTPEEIAVRVEDEIARQTKDGKEPSMAYKQLMRSWPDAMRAGEIHPWYGPCDGMEPNGECAECAKFGNNIVD